MSKRMLIDATHPEEIRVAIVGANNKLEELDFETTTKQTYKGNIYLAKITRVEPSLQAAFLDYGGQSHGFISFSDIHPDYFRLPVDDRRAIEEAAKGSVNEDSDKSDPKASGHADFEKKVASGLSYSFHMHQEGEEPPENFEYKPVETLESEVPETSEVEVTRPNYHRRYKIQEVMQRNQILLAQVVKEARQSKGAVLTTHISLAGRYCVLMPNSPKSGGVSRRITSVTDRKKLREVIDELNLPPTMSIIIRTAGRGRSKAEIKRDANYLLRQWDKIRERTMKSVAPALINEEADLIKRSIRDLFANDVGEILVAGDRGYNTAKSFMHELSPSSAQRVKQYSDAAIPLFQKYDVDQQIEQIYEPVVNLPSGGYLVINQTEALVAIDINSGSATKERHIESTALKTNLEAASEIARQLRLRDLAGLIVIDFIDMEDARNNVAVENRLREAMQADRARIQIGQISVFGLLELSRQRIRPSVLESSTVQCSHCQGTGIVRSTQSSALDVLRTIEEEVSNRRRDVLTVKVPSAVGLHILNNKKSKLLEIEKRYSVHIAIEVSEALHQPEFEIDGIVKGAKKTRPSRQRAQKPHQKSGAAKSDQQKERPDQEARKRHPHPRSQRGRRHRPGYHPAAKRDGQLKPGDAKIGPEKKKEEPKTWWRRLLE